MTGTETIDGQRVEIITIGLTAYIKADQSFWRTYEGVRTYTGITRLRNKYLRVEASDPRFSLISGFPVLPQVLLESLLNDTDIEKGERKIVNGVPTIGLIGAGNGVFYVATQGHPYPIRLEGDTSQNAIDFLDYGKVLDINPPPDNQVAASNCPTRSRQVWLLLAVCGRMVGQIGAPDCGTTYALRVRLAPADTVQQGPDPTSAELRGSARTGVDVGELQPVRLRPRPARGLLNPDE